MSINAQKASARLAAKNAVKIRAALAASVDGRRVYAQYMETNPMQEDLPAARVRARLWAKKNVSLNLAAYKQILAKHYADMYVLGQNEALENMADRAQKGPVATANTKPKLNPQGMPIFDPSFSINWDAWVPGNPAAAALLSKPGGLKDLLGNIDIQARGIADYSHDLLGTALADGIAAGDTPVQIANSIRDSLSSPERALTIAITEGQRAKIEANLNSYQANGVEQIEWTTNDPCDDCKENDGKIVNMGDDFPSGDSEPPVHPNCQCDVIPVMPDLTGTPDYADLTDEEVAARLDDSEMAVRADLAKYNPDQPRDERGRFSSGGGDGSTRFNDTRTPGGSRSLNPKEADDLKGGSGASHLISDGRGGMRFSPERAALHEKIIQERLAGIPKSDNPRFVMLGGGPASGKSTSGVDKWEDPHVKIDVDSIKAQLPEYDPKNPGFVHEESSYIGKEVMARAFAGNQNILLDGTGNGNPASLGGKIDTARAYGYTVEGRYLTVPTEQAVKQDAARARSVGESKVYEIHSAVSQVFPGAAPKFDVVNLYDSRTKGSPTLIATGGSGKLDIVDQKLYSQFLGKANDYSDFVETNLGRS
jgi:SPP1 gp7 family putative phage head morphogenesis protein